MEIVAASICAGWTQHFVLHPIDTLKTRLQYARGTPWTSNVRAALGDALRDLELPQSNKEAAGRVKAASPSKLWSAPLLVDVAGAVHLLKSTRVWTLYAGLVPALVAVVPTAVVYMPTYEFASAALKRAEFPIVAPLAGLATGLVCATVRVPASVLKSRVQLGLAPSALVALQRAIAAGGLRELYAGFAATVALDVTTAVVQFTALDLGRRYFVSNAALGFVAAALATTVSEPIDVVRTRIMSKIKGQPSRFNYKSLPDGLSQAFHTEGIAALYRGLLPRLVLKSLGGAIWYSTYLRCRDLFHNFDGGCSPLFDTSLFLSLGGRIFPSLPDVIPASSKAMKTYSANNNNNGEDL